MIHETDEQKLSIADSTIIFDDIYKRAYFPKEYVDDIKKANMLLIPSNNYDRYEAPVFPEDTSDFLDYIKENADENICVDIAISDDEYNKLELHSALVVVTTFIVTYVALPIAVNLVSNFLYDKAKKHHRKNDELSAEVNIIVQEGAKSKQLSYKGPVSGIESTLNAAIPNLFDKGDS